jgi:hypothetical protein
MIALHLPVVAERRPSTGQEAEPYDHLNAIRGIALGVLIGAAFIASTVALVVWLVLR